MFTQLQEAGMTQEMARDTCWVVVVREPETWCGSVLRYNVRRENANPWYVTAYDFQTGFVAGLGMEWAQSITLVTMEHIDMLLDVLRWHWVRQNGEAVAVDPSHSPRERWNLSPRVQMGGTPVHIDFSAWVDKHYRLDRELHQDVQAMGGAVHLTRGAGGRAGEKCINAYGGMCLEEWKDKLLRPEVLDTRICYEGHQKHCNHLGRLDEYLGYLREQSVEYANLRPCTDCES
eukprot:TRINITY_DN21577_c0_g1_i1.p1 TRINITY_DN21577_c0_g1~~TRINITY_DN21577_c0_g1_i1.p1  ORF type:complete len:232 (+),score=35.35 TRINITY_DN21577_c0_g1_i1:2-697(+)